MCFFFSSYTLQSILIVIRFIYFKRQCLPPSTHQRPMILYNTCAYYLSSIHSSFSPPTVTPIVSLVSFMCTSNSCFGIFTLAIHSKWAVLALGLHLTDCITFFIPLLKFCLHSQVYPNQITHMHQHMHLPSLTVSPAPVLFGTSNPPLPWSSLLSISCLNKSHV